MSFDPSKYSLTGAPSSLSTAPAAEPAAAEEPAAPAASSSSMYAELLKSIGQIGAAAIGGVSASGLQKSQQEHDVSMSKRQADMYGLQARASAAQASAASAAASLAGQGTKKTIYVVGGVLIGLTVIAIAVTALKRGSQEEEE